MGPSVKLVWFICGQFSEHKWSPYWGAGGILRFRIFLKFLPTFFLEYLPNAQPNWKLEVFFCFLPLRRSTFPIRRNLLSCFLRDSHFSDAAPPAIRGASAKLWKEAIQGDPFRLKSSKFLNLCDASQGNSRKRNLCNLATVYPFGSSAFNKGDAQELKIFPRDQFLSYQNEK